MPQHQHAQTRRRHTLPHTRPPDGFDGPRGMEVQNRPRQRTPAMQVSTTDIRLSSIGEVRHRAGRDHAEPMSGRARARAWSRTAMAASDEADAHDAREHPERAVHGRGAAGQRAVVEEGRLGGHADRCGRRAVAVEPGGKPAPALPSVMAMTRSAPLAASATRTIAGCTWYAVADDLGRDFRRPAASRPPARARGAPTAACG